MGIKLLILLLSLLICPVLPADDTGTGLHSSAGGTRVTSSGGGSIGSAVGGGTATQVLYVNGSGNLSGDAGLTFNDSTNVLTATGGFTTGPTADPSIIFDTAIANDTDYWMGIQDDAGGDDDDIFQIGDGTTPGSNPWVTLTTAGFFGIGTAAPLAQLHIGGTGADPAITDGFAFWNNSGVTRLDSASGIFLTLDDDNNESTGLRILSGGTPTVIFRLDEGTIPLLGIGLAGTAPDDELELAAGSSTVGQLNLNPGVAPTGDYNAGVMWHDSTRKTLGMHQVADGADGNQTAFRGTLFTQTQSVTHSNSTTETTLIGTGNGIGGTTTIQTLQENFFMAGKTLHIKAAGRISTAAVPGTLRVEINVGSVQVMDTGDQTPTANLSAEEWFIDATLICRTAGASGTIFGHGYFLVGDGSTNAAYIWNMPEAAADTIDTTGENALTSLITADWGTADSGNSISLDTLIVDVVN